MHTSSVGFGVSADTEHTAETVPPWRPAPPSVVTTLTVQAAWLMPFRNRCRNTGSSLFGPLDRRLPLIGASSQPPKQGVEHRVAALELIATRRQESADKIDEPQIRIAADRRESDQPIENLHAIHAHKILD